MKRAALVLALGVTLGMGSMAFAEEAKPSCAEDLEVLKLVYATSRSSADTYLENLARTDVRLKAVQAQLAEAQKKIQALEAPKPVAKDAK